MSVAGSRSATGYAAEESGEPVCPARHHCAADGSAAWKAGAGAAAALGGLAVLSPGTRVSNRLAAGHCEQRSEAQARNWRLRADAQRERLGTIRRRASVQPHRQLEAVSAGLVEHNRIAVHIERAWCDP